MGDIGALLSQRQDEGEWPHWFMLDGGARKPALIDVPGVLGQIRASVSLSVHRMGAMLQFVSFHSVIRRTWSLQEPF